MGSPLLSLLFMAIFLGLAILYLLTISNTLKAISWENRVIEPGSVWYMLIPIYNYYYYFGLVKDVSVSIENEYKIRNIPISTNPTKTVGVITASLTVAVVMLNILSKIGLMPSLLVSLLAIVQMGFWIAHWVQVGTFRGKIRSLPPIQENPQEDII